MSEVDLNNVLTVKRRSLSSSKAVQFTGKNGREVVAFLKSELGESGSPGNLTVKNGGSYVKAHYNGETGRKAVKGDYVVVDVDGSLRIYDPETFTKLFLVK